MMFDCDHHIDQSCPLFAVECPAAAILKFTQVTWWVMYLIWMMTAGALVFVLLKNMDKHAQVIGPTKGDFCESEEEEEEEEEGVYSEGEDDENVEKCKLEATRSLAAAAAAAESDEEEKTTDIKEDIRNLREQVRRQIALCNADLQRIDALEATYNRVEAVKAAENKQDPAAEGLVCSAPSEPDCLLTQ